MNLVVTKWIGLEGTAILAREREGILGERFPRYFLEVSKSFDSYRSVEAEAEISAQYGAAAVYNVSEGGIFGALWELGQDLCVGLEVELRRIPIRQETVEICEFFDLNPYRMLSGGSLLIVLEDGIGIVEALRKSGVSASIIGRTTGRRERILLNGEERSYLERKRKDELYKLISREHIEVLY